MSHGLATANSDDSHKPVTRQRALHGLRDLAHLLILLEETQGLFL